MQQLKILGSREKKQMLELLKKQFGFVGKLDYVFLLNEKKRKLYIVNRDIEKLNLERLRVNSYGFYFGTLESDGLRLSIEGAQLIGKKCTKNIIELNDEQTKLLFKGFDFEVDFKDDYYLLKHNSDFLGCAKVVNKKLLNHTPKPRRIAL